MRWPCADFAPASPHAALPLPPPPVLLLLLLLLLAACCQPVSAITRPSAFEIDRRHASRGGIDVAVDQLRRALHVMQSTYFALWVGTWPDAIDWTAAVVNTHVASALSSLSQAHHTAGGVEIENELNRYFAQSTAYYFAEDDFALRNEANDDMLWVVLGWLETIQFAERHSAQHYREPAAPLGTWHGLQFRDAFAHRARVFYDIARKGWDTELCGGGMIWNPALEPYKNTITNQLFISASVAMYLFFPGDNNTSPFLARNAEAAGLDPADPHDPSYLRAAVLAYDWLRSSNMTNSHGLYVDGFHIAGWKKDGRGTGKCDDRNEMVYTYNQGVLLSGLRGLWESTGNSSYLTDGHTLVRNTIAATGWSLDDGVPSLGHRWAGLGRAGVLEEICDARGQCSQDAQTFKGIFFHHLSILCEPLPLRPLHPGRTHAADKNLAFLHHRSCATYAPWVAHNAEAAMRTQDVNGRFGSWWGFHHDHDAESIMPEGAKDYRNDAAEPRGHSLPLALIRDPRQMAVAGGEGDELYDFSPRHDLNDRGRGRTVETQSGGVAVLSALCSLLKAESS